MQFMKDKMKAKDEANLEEMKEAIDEAKIAEADGNLEDFVGGEEKSGAAGEPLDAETVLAANKANELLAANEKLEAANKELEDRLLRQQAEFQNFRRRTSQEKDDLATVVTQSIVTDMLPLLDNFERALASDKDAEGFRKGVEMIYTSLAETLKKHGLEYIDTEGKKFDPNFHQAVMRVQNPELEDDTIVAEMQKGYMVKGKVVRPSMVQVVAN